MKRIADWLVSFLRAAACVLIGLALLYLSGCAATPAGVCIPPEVQARCAQEGGCSLFSRGRLAELADEIAQAVRRESCKGAT
jgi:hypothetical protein